MELKDIILAILIIGIPIYIYMSNKDKDKNSSNETIIDKIVAIFIGKKPSGKSIPNYRINDSAISSVNYETIDNNPIINIIRDQGKVTGENTIYYKPEYIPKDTMNPNDIGSTEYRFGQFSEDKPSKAWVDYNISQFPGYYRNDFGEGKRSLKNFFDSKNRFHSVPDNRKYYEVDTPKCPSCYVDVNGTNVCNYNGKLEKIPTSLYNVGPHGNTSLQKVIYSDIEGVNNNQYKTTHFEGDRPMNGSAFYNNVFGSDGVHDLYKPYVHDDVIKCLG